MFTGIIEEIGTVEAVHRNPRSAILTIRASAILEDTRVGDSIAVNGTCLTVTALGGDWFSADVMPETVNRSSLGGLARGAHVNLERALAADGRFDGHIVAGHVDGVGKILRIRRDDTAVWFTIQAEQNLLRYIVEKGSVAVDGISLTVAQVADRHFAVSIIPHTLCQTTLGERREGDAVNLETDILGKYVEKLLRPAEEQPKDGGITLEFLARCGY